MAKDTREAFRIDLDLEHAGREAARVAGWLAALRKRHDLARFEYTKLVRVVPASATYSHPILTLGTRFAETEDALLATYLHEQMHWYLWRLGGPDHDPVAGMFDELVRRYPQAPTRLPEGARNYEQTYVHLVVCFLELQAAGELIGRERAAALADTQYGYRWIYRTVLADWAALDALFTAERILPMIPATDGARLAEWGRGVRGRRTKSKATAAATTATPQKRRAKGTPPPSRKSRRRPRAHGGRSAG